MSFEDFILSLENQNPKIMRAERITITLVSFKAQLKRAFDAGENLGYEKAIKFKDNLNCFDKNKPFDDLFGGIFGKK